MAAAYEALSDASKLFEISNKLLRLVSSRKNRTRKDSKLSLLLFYRHQGVNVGILSSNLSSIAKSLVKVGEKVYWVKKEFYNN